MRWRWGRAVLLVLLLASSLPAADPACLDRTLPVTVMDKEGNLVQGLTAADFRGKFRGKPVEISSLEWDVGFRRVVLVVDYSGSMEAATRVARGVAARMIEQTPPDLSLALIVFGKDATRRMDFSHDRAALLKVVAALSDETTGPTALFDGLAEATEMLNPPRWGDVVYAITDGFDNASVKRWPEVERALAQKGVRLFVLLLRTSLDPGVFEAIDSPRNLTRIIKSTGGNALVYTPAHLEVAYRSSTLYKLEPEEEARLAAALGALYQEIDRFYRLRVRLPREVDKDRTWKLEVVDAQGKRRKDLIVLYPQRLFPCEEGSTAAKH